MSADETQPDAEFKLQKLRLPTPGSDGDVLQVPSLNQIDEVWQQDLAKQNLANGNASPSWSGGSSFTELKTQARADLVNLAFEYSQTYCDANLFAAPDVNRPIVMAGHQPELFHPGVWYKNFTLSRLGNRLNATCINLVIDNDLSMNEGIQVPRVIDGAASTKLVPFDLSGDQIPHEERGILDLNLFGSFGTRVADAIEPFVESPIAVQLWPNVLAAVEAFNKLGSVRLGQAIAAGRHRYEVGLGLRNLEVPLSKVVSGKPFFHFLLQIVDDVENFRTIYNSSLNEYRTAYKLRSRSHPVPALEQIDEWTEVPFWVWRVEAPSRKRLFVKTRNTESNNEILLLSDLDGWQIEVRSLGAVEQLEEFPTKGIKIRPRALATTMFCRLFLSDLFVHGIGGAKYDQLTDLIASRFFDVRLPQYCVMSSTNHLPTTRSTFSETDINQAKQRLRKLEINPEKFIDIAEHPSAQPIIDVKLNWINQTLPQDRMKERHQGIAQCNQKLQPFVEPQKTELARKIDEMKSQLKNNAVLISREFSFCLFPEQLVDRLRVADTP